MKYNEQCLDDSKNVSYDDWCSTNDCEEPSCHRCFPRFNCQDHEKCVYSTSQGEANIEIDGKLVSQEDVPSAVLGLLVWVESKSLLLESKDLLLESKVRGVRIEGIYVENDDGSRQRAEAYGPTQAVCLERLAGRLSGRTVEITRPHLITVPIF